MLSESQRQAWETRLGAAHARLRLEREGALTPLGGFLASPRTNVAKFLLATSFIRLCFRLAGLHRHGYRQFLDARVVDHVVPVPDLHPDLDGVTLLQLSDLHLDLDPELVPAIKQRLVGLRYDIAVITGDFRNLTHGPVEPCLAATLDLLPHLRQPMYAVLGNHDTLAMVPPLEKAGLRFLLNEHIVWRRGRGQLVLAGVDDPRHFDTHDLDRAFAGAPADGVRVLLAHAPSIYREAAGHGVRLMLAGHTHGGQICLPGGRIVLSSDSSPRAFLRGPWRYGTMRGYTSAGTGASGAPVRFHCPAEISRHVLQRA